MVSRPAENGEEVSVGNAEMVAIKPILAQDGPFHIVKSICQSLTGELVHDLG